MSFQTDLAVTPGLGAAYRPGIQALQPRHRAHVTVRETTRLAGSADIDAALEAFHPNASRWDYVVAQKSSPRNREELVWLEVHPASSSSSVDEVERKGIWLTRWIAGTPLANYQRQLIWLASGKAVFTSRSPELKALANRGIRFVGRHFTF